MDYRYYTIGELCPFEINDIRYYFWQAEKDHYYSIKTNKTIEAPELFNRVDINRFPSVLPEIQINLFISWFGSNKAEELDYIEGFYDLLKQYLGE